MTQILNSIRLQLSTLTLLSLLVTSLSVAQNVTGPTPVATGSTQTYSFTDGMYHADRSWTIVGGTQTNTWYTKRPLVVYVTVDWGSTSLGQVVFNATGATLNVTLTGGSGGNTPTDTTLSDENYVHTLAPRIATANTTSLDNEQKIESVTYFDGLGRAKQSNGIRAGANYEDIVTHVAYDPYGRVEKEYLPFAQEANGGAFLTNGLSATTSFYNTTKYENTLNPFSEKEFEASPLNRVFKQAAPGNDWALGNGHEIEMDYQTNVANEVRRYTVDLTFANNTYTPLLDDNAGFYNPNELYKSITRDENHSSGSNHSTEEFKDTEGRVVLKRTYADVNGTPEEHNTYYVYDDYGNLTYVLPPKVNHGATISSIELSELCYQYKYDHRNRLVEKKIPGKDWESIVYDNLDRPVLTQDANLDAQDKWLFTKYDAFGRVIYTGKFSSSSSRVSLQNTFNTKSTVQNYETKLTSNGTLGIYYSNADYPVANLEVLTVNYYDDYVFDLNGGNSETAYGVTPETNVKSLATGSKVRVLGTSDWITSVTYYDDKARPIYIYSKNDYLNTTDKIKSDLTFDGTVIETTTTHARNGFSTITTVDSFTYDHMNRLIDQQQTINGGTTEVIVENTYDELGQLESKGVGGGSGTNRLQTVDYTFNIRGWLKEINDVSNLGNDLFGFKINYNTADHGAAALFNGNISETEWKTDNTDNSLKWYKYSYDALNRITNATDNTGKFNLDLVEYDKNGNIMDLQREGAIVSQPVLSNNSHFDTMDNLDYDYYPNSNRLKSVQELTGGNGTYGFKNGSTASTEYTYDTNGNLLSDANKGITSISYNHLNLPESVSINGSGGNGTITYIYDATGVKLEKSVSRGTTTNYAGNYIYETPNSGSGVLKFFSHPEGYIEPNGSNFDYVYQYKDHLGNIRLSYADADNNGSIDASTEIIEENNYYPFGLEHKGYNNVVNGIENNYKHYQGQEWTEDLDLNMHEWKYRFSDPALGRFISVDPLAEDYYYNSTYAFQENKLGLGTELEGAELNLHPWLVADAVKNPNGVGAHTLGVGQGLANTVTGIYDAVTNPVQTLKGMGNMLVAGAAQGNPAMMLQADAALGSDSFGTSIAMGQAIDGAINDVVNGNGIERGTVIGEVIGAVAGTKGANAALKGASTALKSVGITNPVPSTLARVIPGDVKTTTLGAPSASDVFVTAAKDISGLNATQIAKKLTIPQSSSGFNVIEFSTPKTGLASPINRTNPGFVGKGRTAGGAREFTVPNQPIPANAKVKKIN